MPAVGQPGVFVLFNQSVDVQAVLPELAQQGAPEVGRVGHVRHLVQLFR